MTTPKRRALMPRRVLWVHRRPTLFANTVPGCFPFNCFPGVTLFTQDISRAFHQSKQEEVQEGVADHVAHVDHHLVVDKGGRGEPNSDQHCPRAQDRRSEQAAGEVCYKVL